MSRKLTRYEVVTTRNRLKYFDLACQKIGRREVIEKCKHGMDELRAKAGGQEQFLGQLCFMWLIRNIVSEILGGGDHWQAYNADEVFTSEEIKEIEEQTGFTYGKPGEACERKPGPEVTDEMIVKYSPNCTRVQT